MRERLWLGECRVRWLTCWLLTVTRVQGAGAADGMLLGPLSSSTSDPYSLSLNYLVAEGLDGMNIADWDAATSTMNYVTLPSVST